MKTREEFIVYHKLMESEKSFEEDLDCLLKDARDTGRDDGYDEGHADGWHECADVVKDLVSQL